MNKRKNLSKAIKEGERPLFVHEIKDAKKIYIVDEKDFDNPDKSSLDGIACLVLEYYEKEDELVYSIKQPETFVVLKRGELASLFLTD
ncbi:hypothetical protein [[Muricauda] lutisoli]|uniref:Uncharacterized protein n=1 Tax=[Muricauda] lutisoli TaxID=2816035 RepID=A0ABS3EUF1_9FLAO|nr:hypothetical protein [[Muricauda] lutisoli]MBO0329881.1 hypothetical protein [[Muricauda] lutisoli]